jgi:hypothetical protein
MVLLQPQMLIKANFRFLHIMLIHVGNLYQFALSAKDEAKAVAELTKQHHRAIALYPNTDWGKGVFNAFSKEWQTGQIVKEIPYFYYNNNVTSISI